MADAFLLEKLLLVGSEVKVCRRSDSDFKKPPVKGCLFIQMNEETITVSLHDEKGALTWCDALELYTLTSGWWQIEPCTDVI